MKPYFLTAAAVSLLMLITAAGMISFFGERVQRIAPYPPELREMTGELGSNEGQPVDAIVLDRTHVIAEQDGILYIDAAQQYVLQVLTFRWMAFGVWIGCMGVIALAALVKRFRRKTS